MKNIINVFMITLILSSWLSHCSMTIGTISTELTTNNTTNYSSVAYANDKQMYTTGGLIFTYPVGLFSVPPIVQASVNPAAPHPTTETYVLEISSNSATSTTVMAYKIDSVGVSEAPNGSLDIYFLAIEQEV